jgi:signal peptidase I
LAKPSERRSEKAGMFRFFREMTSALIMALIFIVYVIQAFKIPSGSMEDSLLVGDFLLGLKFIYGAPIFPYSYTKLPGVTSPKPGDVIIFRYPGADNKDYIKRCVAGPGQTVETHGEKLFVDGKEFVLPPKGKFVRGGDLDFKEITDFKPLRIPAKGDVIKPDTCPLRELLFLRSLIHQENPHDSVRVDFQLYLDGKLSSTRYTRSIAANSYNPFSDSIRFCNQPLFADDWITVERNIDLVKSQFPDQSVDIKEVIIFNGKPVNSYTVRRDNYFMMGDNRDNSADSRFWGYLNRNFVEAKAFIIYFSHDQETPWWQLPLKIRWNRIGKLIRSWDGCHQPPPVGEKS